MAPDELAEMLPLIRFPVMLPAELQVLNALICLLQPSHMPTAACHPICAACSSARLVHVSLLVSLQHIEEEYVPDPPILIDLVNEAKLCSHGDPAGSLPVSPKYITIALSQSVCGLKAP